MQLPELAKTLALAFHLARVSKSETRSSLIALAWALRNRDKNRKKTILPLVPDIARFFYFETISSKGRSITVRSWTIIAFLKRTRDESFYRSLAVASLVGCGEISDPTGGSTHFHRHDDWPDWAHHSEPVALIGNWFFYNKIKS